MYDSFLPTRAWPSTTTQELIVRHPARLGTNRFKATEPPRCTIPLSAAETPTETGSPSHP